MKIKRYHSNSYVFIRTRSFFSFGNTGGPCLFGYHVFFVCLFVIFVRVQHPSQLLFEK
ncbi:hypothetical protein DM02DRAFT_23373 [Periconia macrospinosa]|uniref:Uncharacterized protein n=1 Tax=Periconia macrospinosa TaxID=97972 RepID=A0A2V1DLV7_9PLEO|nr:hypothetical protein DM02DRAFT_23373 [Periconia macrospinosa]